VRSRIPRPFGGSTTAGLHSLSPVKLRPTSVIGPEQAHALPRIVQAPAGIVVVAAGAVMRARTRISVTGSNGRSAHW